jgi:hypothetical protein
MFFRKKSNVFKMFMIFTKFDDLTSYISGEMRNTKEMSCIFLLSFSLYRVRLKQFG